MSESKPKDQGSPYPDVVIQGHDYDGIQEYDNPMPAWWLWIFYATIAWSVFYVAALGMGWIDDYEAQLERGELYVAELRASGGEAMAVEVTEDYLAGLLEDQDQLSSGERTYATRCASCHGMEGEGGIGPAFKADLRESERTTIELYEVVRDGIPAGGMPAHEPMMSAQDMAAVTAFIETL